MVQGRAVEAEESMSADRGAPAALDLRQRRLPFTAAVVALCAGHVWLVTHFVSLRAVFSSAPIQGDDFDLHIGQVYGVVEGLSGWGKSWIYDVRLLAGQPEGAITDAGSKGWELWTYALNSVGVPLPIAFNSWVLLCMLSAPLLVFFAGRAFELGRWTSLLAALMTSTLWFFDSFFHWIWFVGMVSWAIASPLSVLTLGLFYRMFERQRLTIAPACAVCLALGHLIHPYTFFAVGLPLAAMYLQNLRRLQRSIHGAVLGCIVFTLAVNAYWLAVSAAHWHYILDSAFYAQGRLSYFVYDFLGLLRTSGDTGVIGVRSGFRVLYLALAVTGFVMLHRAADRRLGPLAAGVSGLLAFAYLGSYVPITAQVQPYRTLVPAILLSTLPAAMFVAHLIDERVFSRAGRSVQLLLGAAGVLLAQHLLSQALYFTPSLLPEVERFPDGQPAPLNTYGFLSVGGAPSHLAYALPHDPLLERGYEDCIAWLDQHAPRGARVLAENNTLGERLAWRGRFEVIGGFLERNVEHALANYFRRYEKRVPPADEIARYLHTFAIDWIAVVSERPEFDALASLLEPHDAVGCRRVYRVRNPAGRVLSGRARVKAATNRIDVIDSDPQLPLVLSYHFHEALRCEPNCRVERERVDLDAVGLIRIPAPHPEQFRIYNAYP